MLYHDRSDIGLGIDYADGEPGILIRMGSGQAHLDTELAIDLADQIASLARAADSGWSEAPSKYWHTN